MEGLGWSHLGLYSRDMQSVLVDLEMWRLKSGVAAPATLREKREKKKKKKRILPATNKILI